MKEKILFVDDEPNVLEGLQRILYNQTKVWDMTFANGSAEATELLAEEQYDAAVLDIKMPEKNGLELLADIKANSRTQDIEVVMLTGLQDRSLKRQAIEMGATDLLNKPVLKEDLVARLSSVLRMKAYRDELQAQNIVLEQQLLQAQKMELIGILASGVIHYLKGILSVIVMDSDYIAQFLTDNPEVRTSLESIKNAGQHAGKILRQIRKFSRQTKAPREMFNLSPVVDGSLDLLRFYIPEGITVEWDGSLTGRMVRADVNQMYQMIMNLCIHAAHAMESKGVLKITLSEAELDADSVLSGYKNQVRPGSYVRLEISDTGVGMDQAAIAQIFEPLSITNKDQEEIGLGLPVAQRIATSHSGLITIESVPGQGTAFVVYLPCA
ncbi:MAG: response regulator [Chloroflexi bacterium]|nr:response regulator [Chloroflexota bacterium]